MKRKTAAALVLVSSAILVGTYTAMREGSSAVIETLPITGSPTGLVTDTPTPTPAYEGCAYMWAYEDLPEISAQVDQAIKELFPEASAHATAFGEDCVYADGHAEFGAMETDFYVTLPVDDLGNEGILGDHIASIMPIILDRFPREILPGPMDGFVEFRFEQSETDSRVLRVPIQKYRTEAGVKTGGELFRLFQNAP